MTALDAITRALKRLRVLGVGQTPKGSEADDCLDALNEMLSEWTIDGIDLAVIPLALSDVLDVPADHESAIVLNLAKRCGGIFGAQLSPDDDLLAQRGRMALVAYHFSIADLRSDNPQSRNNLPTFD